MFDERASAIYLPPGAHADRHRARRRSRRSSSRRRRRPAARPRWSRPAEVEVNARGKGNYAREVHNVFVTDAQRQAADGRRDLQSARATGAATRRTSTTARDGEPVLEEVYYYRVSPPQGFGQQMLYTDRRRKHHAHREGRRRGAAALRLSPGLGAARLQAVLPLGDGRRRAQARRCTRIPRTRGCIRLGPERG